MEGARELAGSLRELGMSSSRGGAKLAAGDEAQQPLRATRRDKMQLKEAESWRGPWYVLE